MRVLFLVALLCCTAAGATPKPYWLCVDEHGTKSARDTPCPGTARVILAPSAAEPGIAPAPALSAAATPSQLQPAATTSGVSSAVTAAQLPQPTLPVTHAAARKSILQPLINVIYKSLLWVIVLIVLIFLLKAAVVLTAGYAKKKVYSIVAGRMPAAAEQLLPVIKNALSGLGVDRRDTRLFPSSQAVRPIAWSLQLLQALEWKRFEILCCELWKLKGFDAQLTCAGPDGGVDVTIRDIAAPEKLYAIAQCKSWVSGAVGVATVRELWGIRHHMGAEHAILLTLVGFTPEAKAFATGKQLELVAEGELLQQILELPVDQRQALLQTVTAGDYLTPTCPRCDVKMVPRTARSGGQGWGCANFPRCRQWFNGRIPAVAG
jgi:hypothetical protein